MENSDENYQKCDTTSTVEKVKEQLLQLGKIGAREIVTQDCKARNDLEGINKEGPSATSHRVN